MGKSNQNSGKIRRLLLMLFPAGAVIFLAVGGFFLYCNRCISACGLRCYDDVEQIPACHYALVLGTAKNLPNGNENFFYLGRIQSAAKLYSAGKVQKLIVSGDNSRKTYDETSDMKRDLIALGVPESAIVCDFAGFRTLDSVYRAKNRLNCRELIIVTQKFHAPRAIYLAQSIGLTAWGYNAPEPDPQRLGWLLKRNYTRERFARCKAWLDVNILKRQPKYAQ